MQGIRSRLAVAGMTAGWLLSAAGCSVETYYNQTASLGGDVAGSAGEMRVAFINNTPFRAIFTYGTYNNTDQFDRPDARQFVGNVRGTTLEGESTTDVVTLSCDRVFAVGDPELLRLIEENGAGDVELDDEALVVGVGFSDAELGAEAAGLATEGFAPEVRALLGVDFPCSSIVVIRFEVDQFGDAPFRADFEVIPPAEDNPR